jgi:hypothetical protein
VIELDARAEGERTIRARGYRGQTVVSGAELRVVLPAPETLRLVLVRGADGPAGPSDGGEPTSPDAGPAPPEDPDGGLDADLNEGGADAAAHDAAGPAGPPVEDAGAPADADAPDAGPPPTDAGPPPPTGPLPDRFWFPLTETDGVIASDRSPGGRDIALYGGTWDQGARFDGKGTGGRVGVPDTNRQPPLTLTAWLRAEVRDDQEGGTHGITPFPTNAVSTDIPHRSGYGIGLNVWTDTGGGAVLRTEGGGSYRTDPQGRPFVAGREYFVAVVYSAARTETYVDGVRLGTAAAFQPGQGSPTYLFIGRHNDDLAYRTRNFFKGTIRDVRAYGMALDAAEVARLYAEGPVGASP